MRLAQGLLSTVCLGSTIFFCFFVLCVLKGIFLKGMGERSPLSKDELLTPATAKVMATNVIHQFHPILPIIAIFCKSSHQLCIEKVVLWPFYQPRDQGSNLVSAGLKDEKPWLCSHIVNGFSSLGSNSPKVGVMMLRLIEWSVPPNLST